MKRFIIIPKKKGKFVIPVLETREFNSPKKLGSYCASDGSLWTTLDDGENIFENEESAKRQLRKVVTELYSLSNI
jgi:hypothetical protein